MTADAPALVPAPGRLRRVLRFLRARRPSDFVAAVLIAASAGFGGATLVWIARHALAVQRLTSGVGDTTFYSADGRPWFPMDEQRRDVSIDQISPNLRNAVIAVEDHRFRYHPGIDPLGLSRAVIENLKPRVQYPEPRR